MSGSTVSYKLACGAIPAFTGIGSCVSAVMWLNMWLLSFVVEYVEELCGF